MSSIAMSTSLPGPSQWAARLGAAAVILGGLVAAVTGPLSLPRGSWLAAYLVLVCGVSLYAMGRVSTWFGHGLAGRIGWVQLAGWNLGNAAVMTGTLTTMPYLVDVGGLILLAVLLGLLRGVFRPATRPGAADARGRHAYAFLLIVLVVSIPVGLVLAHLRAG